MASTTFDIDIDVADDGSTESAALALARLTERLTAAGTASMAASEAVKAAEAAYRQAESAADRAAKAVEKIGLEAEKQRGALKAAMDIGDEGAAERAATKLANLVQREDEAKTKAQAASAAVREQAAALDKLRAASTAAEAAEEKLTEEQKKAEELIKKRTATQKQLDAAASGSGKLAEFAEATGKLGGPIGTLGSKAFGAAEGVKKLIGAAGTGVGAIAAVLLAVTALAGGLIAATVATVKWAITLSDAARTAQNLSNGLAGSEAGGALLQDTIDRLTRTFPLTGDRLRSLATDLAKTGLKGKELASALEEAALKTSRTELGENWEDQMLSLEKQSEIFRLNLSKLFRLDTNNLMRSLQQLIGLFEESSVTGNAIRTVFQDIFQRLIERVAALAPLIRTTFIQFEIWVLKALIAIKPFGSKIEMVAKLIGVAILTVVGVFAALVAILVVASAAFATLLGFLITMGVRFAGLVGDVLGFAQAIVAGPASAVAYLIAKFDEVVAFLGALDLGEIGTQMIMGLVQGILGGSGGVVSAIANVVGGAVDAAESLLGIASPSKVFAQLGAHTAQGMVDGVDDGAGEVQSSLERMVAPPAESGAQPVARPAPTATSGASSAPNLSGAQFVFNVGSVEEEGRIRRILVSILEGDLAAIGAEAEGAAA